MKETTAAATEMDESNTDDGVEKKKRRKSSSTAKDGKESTGGKKGGRRKTGLSRAKVDEEPEENDDFLDYGVEDRFPAEGPDAPPIRFSVKGKKEWSPISSLLRKIGSEVIFVKVMEDHMLLYVENPILTSKTMTVRVPIYRVRGVGDVFSTTLSILDNAIGRRNNPATIYVHQHGVMSFQSGKASGDDMPLAEWPEHITEDRFVEPGEITPTFDHDAQMALKQVSKVASLRTLDSGEILDVQVEGNGNRMTVGCVSNGLIAYAVTPATFEGSTVFTEEALQYMVALGDTPFELSRTQSHITIRTADSTITLPAPSTGPQATLEQARELVRAGKDNASLTVNRAEKLGEALGNQSFLFTSSVPVMFTCKEDHLVVSTNSDVGRMDERVLCSYPDTGDVPELVREERVFGLRANDVSKALNGMKGIIRLRLMKQGVLISNKLGEVTTNILMLYYQ